MSSSNVVGSNAREDQMMSLRVWVKVTLFVAASILMILPYIVLAFWQRCIKGQHFESPAPEHVKALQDEIASLNPELKGKDPSSRKI